MKEMILLFLVISSVIFSQSAGNDIITINQDLTAEEIAPDVYFVVHHFPFGSNSLLVKVDSAEFILVDTPFTNEATEVLYNWMKEKFGEFNLKVINGHFHGDCLGGNHYFNCIGIPTYGSYLTAKLNKEKGNEAHESTLKMLDTYENKRYYNIMKDNIDEAPTHLFRLKDGLVFEYPHDTVEVYFPGEAHAPDNIVVYFRNKNVLFGGCMIKSLNNNSKGYKGDANFDTWAQSVQNVIDRFGQAKIVTPGHGEWGDNSLLTHTYNIFK